MAVRARATEPGAAGRPATGEEGTVLVIALAFLSLFGILIAVVLSFTDTSLRASRSLEGQRNAAYAADGATEAAIQRLRNDSGLDVGELLGSDNGKPCGLTLPASGDAPESVVECTPEAASGGVQPVNSLSMPPFAVLALGEDDPLVADSVWADVTVDGDVVSNGTVRAAGWWIFSGLLTAQGDVRARGACTPAGRITEESPGDGTLQCDAAGSPLGDPGIPSRTDVGGDRAVPACPSDPDEDLVVFEPGRYRDLESLNELFGDCHAHDFWFKPGAYLFDFLDQGLLPISLECDIAEWEWPARQQYRWCVGDDARLVGGTPQGWSPNFDPVDTSTRPAAAAGSQGDGVDHFQPVDDARLIDDDVASSRWGTGNPTLVPQSATSSGGNHFPGVDEGRVVDGSVTTTAWTGGGGNGSATGLRGTQATGDFSNPERALAIEGGNNPPYADAPWPGPGTRNVVVTGYPSPVPNGAAIDSAVLHVRHRVQTGGLVDNPQIVVTRGPAAGGGTCTLGIPKPSSGWTVTDVDVSGCLDSAEAVNGAGFEYRVSGGCFLWFCPRVRLDGMELDVSWSSPLDTRGVTLADLETPIPDPVDVTAVTLRVAHAESTGTSPRIRVEGSATCGPLALPERSSLTTDTLDLAACLDTAARVNGAEIVYEADGPAGGGAGSASLDGIELQVTYDSEDGRSVTLSSYLPALPDPVQRVDRVALRVRHAETGGTTPRVTIDPGGPGPSCGPFDLDVQAGGLGEQTLVLREPDGSGGFQGLDPGCLDTAGRLNGAGVTVEVLRNGLADVTAEIDGTELEVTYKAYADPIPAWATQACDPGAEGVQFVFTGRSRVFAAGGTIELCAGPDDPGTEATAQRVAFHAGSAAGCVASNACPVLGTAGGLFNGGAAIHGTVVAPEALVELKGSSPVPVVDRGIVARRLLLDDDGGVTIRGGRRPPPEPRIATLVARVDGGDRVRARVCIDDVPADDKPCPSGAAFEILEWSVIR